MPGDLGTVIVTGGASGLGQAVAEAVAGAGGTPVVFDLNEPASGDLDFVRVYLADPRAACACASSTPPSARRSARSRCSGRSRRSRSPLPGRATARSCPPPAGRSSPPPPPAAKR